MIDDGITKAACGSAEPSHWRGFLTESKSFMGYGEYTPRLKFWRQFPVAAFRFYRCKFRDWSLRRRGYAGLWH